MKQLYSITNEVPGCKTITFQNLSYLTLDEGVEINDTVKKELERIGTRNRSEEKK